MLLTNKNTYPKSQIYNTKKKNVLTFYEYLLIITATDKLTK